MNRWDIIDRLINRVESQATEVGKLRQMVMKKEQEIEDCHLRIQQLVDERKLNTNKTT